MSRAIRDVGSPEDRLQAAGTARRRGEVGGRMGAGPVEPHRPLQGVCTSLWVMESVKGGYTCLEWQDLMSALTGPIWPVCGKQNLRGKGGSRGTREVAIVLMPVRMVDNELGGDCHQSLGQIVQRPAPFRQMQPCGPTA